MSIIFQLLTNSPSVSIRVWIETKMGKCNVIKCIYYCTCLALRVGKVNTNPILWLATWMGWGYLAHSELPTFFCKKIGVIMPYNIILLCSEAYLVKVTGYWSCSFFSWLWNSPVALHTNTQKRNLPSIQSSWPHTGQQPLCIKDTPSHPIKNCIQLENQKLMKLFLQIADILALMLSQLWKDWKTWRV